MTLTRALLATLLGGTVTLPAMCNVYKLDVAKLCDAEARSGSTLQANRAAVFAWMERNVASSQGVVFVKNLEGKDARGIGIQLREAARTEGVPSCALADTTDQQARVDDFHEDVVDLCAGSAPQEGGSVARLDVSLSDDTERMREIVLWTTTNAKSPDTRTVVAKLAAAPPKQRGTVLRAEAAKVGVTTCLLATTLDAAPPSPSPDDPVPSPNFTVQKVDGPLKNQALIAAALTGPDASAAINGCYAAQLRKTRNLTGRVSMKLSFDGAGHITAATDDGSVLKGPIPDCLSAVLVGVALEAPLSDAGKKGAKATATLLFTPSTTGPGYGATIDPQWLSKARPRRK